MQWSTDLVFCSGRQNKSRAAFTEEIQRTLFAATRANETRSHEEIEPNTIQGCLSFSLPLLHYHRIESGLLTLHHDQVSVSAKLYDYIHFLWLNEAPVGELQ